MTEVRAGDHLRSLGFVAAVIGFIVIVIFMASISVRESDLRAVSKNECVRVQRLRETVNQQGAVVWLTNNSAAKRERRLSQTTITNRGTHRANAAALTRLGARLRYQPPTDCGLAINGGYKRPASRPFTEKLANDLTRR